MSQHSFPDLTLANWQPTRDTIQAYAQVLGKIRRALTPKQKHWWHVSLHAAATGLTTTPIPWGAQTFEVRLDFAAHQVVAMTSRGEAWHKPLRGQPPARFAGDLLAALAGWEILPAIDRSQFAGETPGTYDWAAVGRWWQALAQIDSIFKQFKGELRQETSPVQLWPHHFDLSLLWITGNLVPGQDPDNEEWADEQMNFGFSTGDEAIPDPYFYATAYPAPAGLTAAPLPAGARWNRDGFTGAILPYSQLVGVDAGGEKLLGFLRAAQQAGAALMLRAGC